MNMLPFTNAPRFPNIGFVSTSGVSGTRARNRSRSASVGLGIFMRLGSSRSAVTLVGIRVSHSSGGDRRRRKECQPVSEYLQVWKAKVAANDVDALRDIEPKAIKEAQTPGPELLGPDL